MPTIYSASNKMEDIRFLPFNGTMLFKNADIIVGDAGQTIIIKQQNGNLRSNVLRTGRGYLPGVYKWSNSVLNGLVRLGVISKEAMQDHIEKCKQIDAEKERKYAAEYVGHYAEKLGMKFTKAQLEIINKAAEGAK